MEIVSEVKTFDLGEGYVDTELLGFVCVEQTITLGHRYPDEKVYVRDL